MKIAITFMVMIIIELIELMIVNPGGILTDNTPDELLDYYANHYGKEE